MSYLCGSDSLVIVKRLDLRYFGENLVGDRFNLVKKERRKTYYDKLNIKLNIIKKKETTRNKMPR